MRFKCPTLRMLSLSANFPWTVQLRSTALPGGRFKLHRQEKLSAVQTEFWMPPMVAKRNDSYGVALDLKQNVIGKICQVCSPNVVFRNREAERRFGNPGADFAKFGFELRLNGVRGLRVPTARFQHISLRQFVKLECHTFCAPTRSQNSSSESKRALPASNSSIRRAISDHSCS